MAGFLDVKEKDIPTIRIMQFNDFGDIHKYKFIKDYNEKNIIEFVQQYDKGMLKRTIKSQEPPAKQESDIIVVVGNSLQELVVDNPKDVILLFTTVQKECELCLKFYEDYLKLVKNLAHNEDLQFATIDGIENEVIGAKINNNLPFIKFYTSENKNQPLSYSGAMLDYAITNWIMEFSTNPVSRTPKYDL